MDTKLRKLLDKPARVSTDTLPDDDFFKNLVSQVLANSNYLIATPPGSEKISITSGVISHVGGTVWHVSSLLTLYRIFHLKSAFSSADVSVMSVHEKGNPDSRVLIWSPDILMAHLAEPDRLPCPALVIFDNPEFLCHPVKGGILEECIICLPRGIPVLVLGSWDANPEELAAWLEISRQRPCQLLKPDIPHLPKIPAFISSQWEMPPLTDKKRISGKVKRILKEEAPIRNVKSPRFLKALVSFLRKEKLVPAIIAMSSEDECDLAVRSCDQITENVGEALTHPLISAVLDRHPLLKDHPFLPVALSKQAGPLHAGHHPLWCKLVEHFLSVGSIDVIFGTPESLGQMMTRVKTALLCLSRDDLSLYTSHAITKWQTDRIARLVGRNKTESAGCIAVAHTHNVDVAHIKELLIQTQQPLTSTFQCDCRTVLGILASRANHDNGAVTGAPELLDRLVFAFRNPRFGEFCMEEFLAQLHEELPEAACYSYVRAIVSLKDIRLRLSMRISKLADNLKFASGKKKSEMAEELRELEIVFSQIPCEECVHYAKCQKRGSRKLRKLIEEYDEIKSIMQKNITGIRLDFQYYARCLQESGLADPDMCLTNEGIIALRTGLHIPQPFTECIKEQILPADDESLSFALAGGFAEMRNKESWNQDSEFETGDLQDYYHELIPVYEKMKPVLARVRKQMLRFGILTPGYDLSRSVLLLAWKKGRDMETLARNSGITAGAMMKLIYKAKWLS